MTNKAKRNGIRAFMESRSSNPIQTTAFLLMILFVILIVFSLVYYRGRYSEYLGVLLSEAHGMIFDLIVIGLLLAWLYRTDEKRRRIQDYKEEIDDFRKWNQRKLPFAP